MRAIYLRLLLVLLGLVAIAWVEASAATRHVAQPAVVGVAAGRG